MSPEELFEQNKKLVAITLKKMFKNPKAIAEKHKISYDDLLQYGYEALWESCLGYKKSKGKFSTYTINSIRNNVVRRLHLDCRIMKYDKKAKKAPKDSELYTLMSIDNKVPETGDTFHDYIKSSQYINVENEAILNLLNEDIFNLLSDKEKTILHMKLEGRPMHEIGEHFGLTHQMISVYFKEIKQKIKQYFIKVRLNEIYGVCG